MDNSNATPFECTPVPGTLPLVCLRNTVVFPLDVVSVVLDRPRSIRLIADSSGDGVIVGCFFPKDIDSGEINEVPDLMPVGVACRVIHRMRMPNETVQVVLQGLRRIRLDALEQHQPYLQGKVTAIASRDPRGADIDGLIYRCMEMVDQLVKAEGGYPPEMVNILRMNIAGAGRFADLIGAHVKFPSDIKWRIAATDSVRERLRRVEDALRESLARFEVQAEVQEKVRADLEGRQREHILRAQLKTIREELGIDGDAEAELLELRDRIESAGLSEAAMAVATRELDRLSSMTPASSEFHVSRTYLGWLLDLPWKVEEPKTIDLRRARRVLDRDHHGLQDVKERILEFLAVCRLTGGQGKAPVLCLSGPPGVGKTSLGRSIAEALGRRFVRVSVGGMRDEAEIKGHRRTYVGAMPGKILQEVKRAESNAPVFVIDEIDKMGSDARGDPSSAMLEVLDPEQNHGFLDHYLDVPYDLSHVFFVCTANMLDSIPGPLRDRMEIVQLSGYTAREKLEIARKHLVPRVLEENGLTRKQISFTQKGLQAVIEGYTREAGVRELHRLLGRICRRRALEVAQGDADPAKGIRVSPKHVARVLGAASFEPTKQFRTAQVGVTAGLAWTPVGGDLLFFEAALVPGNGQIKVTGRLGEVMRESCETALSWLRASADRFEIPDSKFAENDIHLHVPDGATPKDGPSAGVTIAACLASLLTGRPARADVAMTGEISLKGRVLPVGGVKEKVLAAHRAGMRQVILPIQNKKDVAALPAEVRRDLDIRLTSNVMENLQAVLMPIFLPQPGRDSDQHLLPPDAPGPGLSAVR